MKPNEILKRRRLELGLSETEVAKASGLSVYQIGDVEQYEDELLSAITLSEARMLCAALALSLNDAVRIPPGGGALAGSRAQAICFARMQKGLTVEELGDLIGFEAEAITNIEASPDFVDELPGEVALNLARILGLSAAALLRPGT
ncbi:helix-turn-helix domain-containing protein [Dyella silvae]|uniref:helix-turn-helix domain-containing protein n=1 Tax=Dyella silvae TaxID=2994424 RepID=UPI002263F9B4|nr:helix-turn-helix transcriptional regulator [Dyella silvae]